MNCYLCDQEGKDSPAVAICTICGMALCKAHAIREELPMCERVDQGMAPTCRKLPLTMPRFVCEPCRAAMHQSA